MELILGNPIAELSLVVFIGLVFGSFASMLCYRLPRDIPIIGGQGVDDVTPKEDNQPQHSYSFCPHCQARLKFFDLLPILSYVFQGGKCRHCKKSISIQYPIIECLTLILAVLAYAVMGLTLQGGIMIAMAPILVSLFVIDWNFKILPNVLNLALFIGGVAYQLFNLDTFLFYALSAIVYPASMIFIRWVFLKITGKDGLGWGDIKFFAAAGIWLGLEVFSAYLLLSSVLGIVFGVTHKWITKDDVFPFGPALIVAYLICFYTKDWILTVL